MTSPRRTKSQAGFTLVELLVAITVLAILAGFLAPAVIAALSRAKEAAVVFEMKQMELAVEQFKNDYGFYPPVIDSDPARGAAIRNIVQLRNYLNKIAPQNAESSTSFPGSGNSRIQDWWTNVGSNLNERSSLQFWLSGLCKNKQYPLTGGVSVDTNNATAGVMTLAGYGADRYSDGTAFPAGLTIERNDYYEFKKPQVRTGAGGAVAFYEQTIGDFDSGAANPRDFRYLDYKSYSGAVQGYYDGLISGNPNYINPKGFQLVTFGRDGLPGSSVDVNTVDAAGTDNLTNFTQGQLQLYGN